MCGRYVSVSSPEQLAEYFEADEVSTGSLGERYNVAPTLDVYALIDRDGSRRLGRLRWGFIPYWAEDLKSAPVPINARVEGVADSRMFARSFRKRRCILPADGFYEWREREPTGATAEDQKSSRARGSSRKQPYFIHDPDDEPLALAGIWTAWRGPDGERDEPVYSAAILTTAAEGPIADLHPRMPVMLPRQLWSEWLRAGPDEAPHLHEVMSSLGAPRLEAYAITDRVSNVNNDGPELLEAGTVDDV